MGFSHIARFVVGYVVRVDGCLSADSGGSAGAGTNQKGETMINLAGVQNCDETIKQELRSAGIDLVFHEKRTNNEVPYSVTGELKCGRFVFTRAWYYWVVQGKVPLDTARLMYADESRKDVRVAGDCGSPPPDEWAEPSDEYLRHLCAEKGYPYDQIKDNRTVNVYHIDTQEGLEFFVRHVTGRG